jgi:hypothetical protein
MKRKTKRFKEGGGYGRFVDDSPKSVEDQKVGLFAGAPAPDESDTYAPKTRKFTTVSPDKPKPRPAAPKVSAEQSARNYAKLEAEEKNFQPASSVMKRGQAGQSDSGRNPSLDRLMSDREATASREARRRSAMVDKANAGVPERRSNVDVAKERLGMKKGGKTASARADGIAQRGKTRGKMC